MPVQTTQHHHAQTALAGRSGMVTSNHVLAAEAGATVLARGGNAVDAAVATAFAVGVVEPAMSGIGGRGYMLIHFGRRGETAVIDGHERAPRLSRPDMYRVAEARQIPTQGWGPQVPVVDQANQVGHLAVAVPGVVGALAAAHAAYGRLPLATVLESAIALADEGFEVGVPLAVTIANSREKLARFPATADVFLPGGYPPKPGDRLRQPDLARSYRLIAAEGPDAFYRGPIAQAISAEMERGGGVLRAADMAEFEARRWAAPLAGDYRGYRILTMPEATGGVTLIQIMNLLEGFDMAALDPYDPRTLHLLLEAERIAFRDRLAVIEDPAFAPVPYAGLASKAFAAERQRLIRPDRTLGEIAPGDAWSFDGAEAPHPAARAVGWRAGDHDTTHFCVVDAELTAVSMTQSIIDAFGSGVLVPGTGILLNSAMHNFNPIPGQLGAVAPWKRSVHNGTPAIVLRPDGAPHLAIGGAGGTKIITGVAQILVDMLDRNRPAQTAVEAPRVHNEGWASQIDARFGEPCLGALRKLGHDLEVVRPAFARPGFSRINAIASAPDGTLTSGVDPFTDAGAAAPG